MESTVWMAAADAVVRVVQSAAKGGDAANKDVPLHIYGPPGVAEYLSTMMSCSDTFLSIAVLVHEFVSGPVSEEDAQPTMVNWRAKIWKVCPCSHVEPPVWQRHAWLVCSHRLTLK